MITKKNATIISVVSLFIFCVFSLMPCIITQNYWKADVAGLGSYTKTSSWNDHNLFQEPVWLLPCLLFVLAIVGIAALVIIYNNPDHSLAKSGLLAPAAMVILFVIFSLVLINTSEPIGEPAGTATKGYYGFYDYEISWGYYILSALLLLGATFSTLLYYGKFSDISAQSSDTPSDYTTELIQLKKLLDSGIITSEDFEEKKKQLLNLTNK